MKIFRKCILLTLTFALMVSFFGCGKKNASNEAAFQPTDEVLEATASSGVMQIDDIVLNVNMKSTVKEFMDSLAESRDASLFGLEEYNEQMLVAPGYSGKYKLSKSGEDYIDVTFWNKSDETVYLAECFVVDITPYATALPFFWFGGGMNFDTSSFNWDNFLERLEKAGFTEGVTDPSSRDARSGSSVYKEASETTNFKYNITINYDEIYTIETTVNSDPPTYKAEDYMQTITYILTFDKDTHACIGVQSQGFRTVKIQYE